MFNLVTEAQAKAVLAAIIAALPNMPTPEAKVISYLPFHQPEQDGKEPWMIVWPNGFQVEVSLVAASMEFSPGLWAVRLKLEYDAYVAGHQPAMPGTDEPYTYFGAKSEG